MERNRFGRLNAFAVLQAEHESSILLYFKLNTKYTEMNSANFPFPTIVMVNFLDSFFLIMRKGRSEPRLRDSDVKNLTARQPIRLLYFQGYRTVRNICVKHVK